VQKKDRFANYFVRPVEVDTCGFAQNNVVQAGKQRYTDHYNQ
jgi:hypothetical protein